MRGWGVPLAAPPVRRQPRCVREPHCSRAGNVPGRARMRAPPRAHVAHTAPPGGSAPPLGDGRGQRAHVAHAPLAGCSTKPPEGRPGAAERRPGLPLERRCARGGGPGGRGSMGRVDARQCPFRRAGLLVEFRTCPWLRRGSGPGADRVSPRRPPGRGQGCPMRDHPRRGQGHPTSTPSEADRVAPRRPPGRRTVAGPRLGDGQGYPTSTPWWDGQGYPSRVTGAPAAPPPRVLDLADAGRPLAACPGIARGTADRLVGQMPSRPDDPGCTRVAPAGTPGLPAGRASAPAFGRRGTFARSRSRAGRNPSEGAPYLSKGVPRALRRRPGGRRDSSPTGGQGDAPQSRSSGLREGAQRPRGRAEVRGRSGCFARRSCRIPAKSVAHGAFFVGTPRDPALRAHGLPEGM